MICFLPAFPRSIRAASDSLPVAVQLGLEACQTGETLAVQVHGSCMEPFLHDGQRVTVTPKVAVWPGDVVALVGEDGHLRVHRLLLALPRFAGGQWLTKPDAAEWMDAPTPLDRSLGRVRRGSVAERLGALLQIARLAGRSLRRRVQRGRP